MLSFRLAPDDGRQCDNAFLHADATESDFHFGANRKLFLDEQPGAFFAKVLQSDRQVFAQAKGALPACQASPSLNGFSAQTSAVR